MYPTINTIADFKKALEKHGFKVSRCKLEKKHNFTFEISVFFFCLNLTKWIRYNQLKHYVYRNTCLSMNIIYKRIWY